MQKRMHEQAVPLDSKVSKSANVLRNHGDQREDHSGGHLPASGSTCAEDAGFYALARNNYNIPRVISRMSRFINQGLRQHALAPSHETDKSQVLLSINGHNRASAKLKVLCDLKKTTNMPEPELDINVVATTKHLGWDHRCGRQAGARDQAPAIANQPSVDVANALALLAMAYKDRKPCLRSRQPGLVKTTVQRGDLAQTHRQRARINTWYTQEII